MHKHVINATRKPSRISVYKFASITLSNTHTEVAPRQLIPALLLGVWGVVCSEVSAHAYGSKTSDGFPIARLFRLSI